MKQRKPLSVAPFHQTNWDVRAAINFIGGGSGAGLLLFAAAAATVGVNYRWPALLGLALIAVGLLFVWLEIGRPWRAIHVFFHPQTSWMTREGIVAPFLFAAVAAALWRGGAFTVLAAALGLVFLYCQARILRAAKGIPAWRQPRIVALIIATGLTEGAGLMLLLGYVLGVSDGLGGVTLAAFVLLLARAVAWYAYRRQIEEQGAPMKTLQVYGAFGKWFLLLGHALPGALLAVALAGGPPWLLAIGGLMATLGGWALKFVIVTKAAYNQGFHLPIIPVRGSGEPQAGIKPGWG